MDLLFDGKKFRESGVPINDQQLTYRFYYCIKGMKKRGPQIVEIPDGIINYEPASEGDYKAVILPTPEILAHLNEMTHYYLRVFGGDQENYTDRTILILAQYRRST